MLEWKKICCATDFSEPSRLAMLKAAELARRLDGDLELVHVRAPPSAAGADMLVAPCAVLVVRRREPTEADAIPGEVAGHR